MAGIFTILVLSRQLIKKINPNWNVDQYFDVWIDFSTGHLFIILMYAPAIFNVYWLALENNNSNLSEFSTYIPSN